MQVKMAAVESKRFTTFQISVALFPNQKLLLNAFSLCLTNRFCPRSRRVLCACEGTFKAFSSDVLKLHLAGV